jgi:eukaryotic-like serine/threonine-protein kinase
MGGVNAMSESTSGPDLFNMLADEFAERYRRGERPRLSEYAEKYPELADEIHELFPALVAIEQFGSGVDPATGPSAPRLEPAGPIPERLGDYRILREIARGGMGIVYEAVQESLGRHVALKVLPQYHLHDSNQLERFQREARAAAMLHHTNIVPVFGIGEHNGVHHYAMQYIQGQSLDAVLREVKRLRGFKTAATAPSSVPRNDPALAASVAIELLSGRFAGQSGTPAEAAPFTSSRSPPTGADPATTSPGAALNPAPAVSASLSQSGSSYYRTVARLVVQAAEALAYAHLHKLLHRDIKPSNLLLDLQGTLWVTDFGLVKAEGTDPLTQTGDIVGTLRYMAPERFRGPADGRSDIYALGLTLYEMLTLEPAFAADQRSLLIDKILHDEPSKPRQIDPRIPSDLETIALKAIARHPSDRYRTASELAEDLKRYLADRPILARRASAMEKARRWCRRNPLLAASGAIVAAALVAVAALALLYAATQTKATQRITALADNLRTSLAESNRLLAVRNFDRGQGAFDKEQIGAGLHWMIESWRAAAAAGDPALQHAARANLSAWLPYHPRLKAVLPQATAAAFKPDGKLIVAGDRDGTVRQWDLTTCRPTVPTIKQDRQITSVTFSPDGKTVLTGSLDGTARLWDAATGRAAGLPLQHQMKGEVSVAFSPDGQTVLTYGFESGTLRLWDAASGRPIGQPRQNLGLRVYSRNTLPLPTQLWDAATGRYLGPSRKIPAARGAVALSPDGGTVLTAHSDGMMRLWDAVTGQPLISARRAHNDWVRFATFSPDGETFLTGSTDKTARLWDAVTGRPIGLPLIHQASVRHLAFSPDGKLLTTIGDSAVRVWEVEPYQPTRLVLDLTSPCTAAAFSPDGKMILTGGSDGMVRLWDAITGQPLFMQRRGHYNSIQAVAFSPDGKIALTASKDTTARMWAVPSGRPIGPPLEQQCRVNAAAFSPDGKTFVTGGDDGTVRRWDTATGALLGTPFRPVEASTVLAFSPDGKTFFVTNTDKTITQTWAQETRSKVGQPYLHPSDVEFSALSSDGRSLLTGSIEMARLWDVASGTLKLPPLASQSYISSLAIRADAKVVAAGNQSGVQFWDAATGQPIGPTLRHPAAVNALAFSPDGKFLLAGCRDGKARVFREAPEVPDDLDRVANWVEVVTGVTLEPGQGEIQVLENAAWLASRERLEQRGEPPESVGNSDAAPEGRPTGLAWTLAQVRSDGIFEEFWLAWELARVSPYHEAVAVYRQSLVIAERLMAKYPGEPDYLGWVISGPNTTAWQCANDPDLKLRDPAQAVELARMVVRVARKVAECWNTLGAALYRNGDWPGAIEALRKSNELNAKSTLGYNAYFLAMAHWRRGEFTAARIWFDIAGRWHHRVAPADEELRRFRAEAAALLGLGPEADREIGQAPADDPTLARLVLEADPTATWARTWLGHSRSGLNKPAGPPADVAIPNGPQAFAPP